jgi:hypothetical protein
MPVTRACLPCWGWFSAARIQTKTRITSYIIQQNIHGLHLYNAVIKYFGLKVNQFRQQKPLWRHIVQGTGRQVSCLFLDLFKDALSTRRVLHRQRNKNVVFV